MTPTSKIHRALACVLLITSIVAVGNGLLRTTPELPDYQRRYPNGQNIQQTSDLPKPSRTHTKSSVESVDVFHHGEGGFPCIRIPAVTRCGGRGTLHAFAECRMSIGDGCIPFNYKNTTDRGSI